MKLMGSTGQSLTEISDESLLELLLRQDLPGFLTNTYNAEADRRLTTVKEPQPMTALSLPFLQGGER